MTPRARSLMPPDARGGKRVLCFALVLFWVSILGRPCAAAEMPLIRIAHGAFNEKVAALWVGVEQGFFKKHGVNVEVIHIRSGPQTMAAMASGDIQMAYTVPGSVLGAHVSGMDAVFFAGLVNRADGDFVSAQAVRTAEELRGKRVGVQSIGGGVWSLAMLAMEHLGLEPTRDKIVMLVVGDQSVLTQALATGRIDAAYLGYTFSTRLKGKGFNVLLDIGRAPIPYQGLALVARRSYLKRNPEIADAVLRGALESVLFVQNPSHKRVVLDSLAKHLRLKSPEEAETGYGVLQWLYNVDIKPNVRGIQNMQRLLSIANPKVAGVKAEEVVEPAPVQRMEKSAFYQELLARKGKSF